MLCCVAIASWEPDFVRSERLWGAPKAIKAMARHLGCLVYRLVTRGEEYVDRGQKAFQDHHAERQLLSLQRKAHSMGFELVAQTAVAAN